MDSHEAFNEPNERVTRTLAEQLDLPIVDFIGVFGSGWQEVPNPGHDYDADPAGKGDLLGEWSIAGEPFQLMLRILRDSACVEVARPRGIRSGSHAVWLPDASEVIPGGPRLLESAAPVIDALVRKRRQAFRYCSYCRRITAPEDRFSSDLCYGCASTWHGVVY